LSLRTRIADAFGKMFGAPFAPADRSFTPPTWWPAGWWQAGARMPGNRDGSAAVEACISAIAQTVAMLPPHHWRERPDGGRDLISNSPAARVLRKPNAYQTRADFFLNLVRSELFRGNGYAVAERDRGVITALHPVPAGYGQPMIDRDSREVFYSFSQNSDLLPSPPVETLWPASEVLHVRMHTPTHPLMGVTPLRAAALAVNTGETIQAGVGAFMANMVRPSGYLAVPPGVTLSKEVAEQLRQDWTSNAQGQNQGKLGVLMAGIKWEPLSMEAFDEAVVAAYRMTVADVARVFRTPLPVIGELGGATFQNSETLIRHWHATGLGFVIEHLELALDALFDLPPGDYIEFDVEYILRSDFAARMDGLAKAVQGGIYAPNEARRREGLPDKDGGDIPRLQAQMVPIDAPVSAAVPAPVAPAVPENEPAPEPAERQLTLDQKRAITLDFLRRNSDAA
jgi:HK97 family phage portal protein